jgi:hypothetical protein
VVASRRLPGKEATLEAETFSHASQRRSSRCTEVCPQIKPERHISGVMNALVAQLLVTSPWQATVLAKEDMHVVDLQDQSNHSQHVVLLQGAGVIDPRWSKSTTEVLAVNRCRRCWAPGTSLCIPVHLYYDTRSDAPCLILKACIIACVRESVLEAHSVGDVWRDDVR